MFPSTRYAGKTTIETIYSCPGVIDHLNDLEAPVERSGKTRSRGENYGSRGISSPNVYPFWVAADSVLQGDRGIGHVVKLRRYVDVVDTGLYTIDNVPLRLCFFFTVVADRHSGAKQERFHGRNYACFDLRPSLRKHHVSGAESLVLKPN